MRLSAIMLSLSIAAAALAALGLWSFYSSFASVPAKLDTFIGDVAGVRTHTAFYSKSHVTFQLKQKNAEVLEFSYTPLFKRFFYFAEHVNDGMKVEVTTGPGGMQDLWGLKLESQVLMTPAEARDARLTDGRWGVGLFLGFLVTAFWAARQASDLRRAGS